MTSKGPFSAFLWRGLWSAPHPQTRMRAACTSPKSMAPDVGYMRIPRGGLTKVGVASTN